MTMRGFDPTGVPMTAAEALATFLDALGVPPERMPATVDAQAGLYRELLAQRRVLVVLDNVRDAEQVRPLLPGAPACAAVVVSRNQLPGLVVAEGARPLRLDLLDRAQSRSFSPAGSGRRGWPPSRRRCSGSSIVRAGCRWPWRSWRPARPPIRSSVSTRSPASWTDWTRSPAPTPTSGRSSPGRTGISGRRRPGCSSCWPRIPART